MSLLDLQGLVYRRAAGRPGEAPAFALTVPRFRLERGERVAVAGPSGSGKSSFLDLIALLRAPAQIESFHLGGVDVAPLWAGRQLDARVRLRARNVGYVLQTGGLLPYLSVEENVMLSQRLLGRLDTAWVAELLDTLDIAPLRRRLPAALSLGERQRVAIARALAHRPALVLADEPSASLDADNAERVFALLVSLCTRHGTGLVLVSHDRELTRRHGLTEVACERSAHGAVISR
ncbi:MAG: ATP-binding cassette domain-containing protein [Caldimonas sp.]